MKVRSRVRKGPEKEIRPPFVGALAQNLLRGAPVDQKGDFCTAHRLARFSVNDVGLDRVAADRSEKQCKIEDGDPAQRLHPNHKRAPHWEQKRWLAAPGAPQAVQKKAGAPG